MNATTSEPFPHDDERLTVFALVSAHGFAAALQAFAEVAAYFAGKPDQPATVREDARDLAVRLHGLAQHAEAETLLP